MTYHVRPREDLRPLPPSRRVRLTIAVGRARVAAVCAGNVALTVIVVVVLHALGAG